MEQGWGVLIIYWLYETEAIFHHNAVCIKLVSSRERYSWQRNNSLIGKQYFKTLLEFTSQGILFHTIFLNMSEWIFFLTVVILCVFICLLKIHFC